MLKDALHHLYLHVGHLGTEPLGGCGGFLSGFSSLVRRVGVAPSPRRGRAIGRLHGVVRLPRRLPVVFSFLRVESPRVHVVLRGGEGIRPVLAPLAVVAAQSAEVEGGSGGEGERRRRDRSQIKGGGALFLVLLRPLRILLLLLLDVVHVPLHGVLVVPPH